MWARVREIDFEENHYGKILTLLIEDYANVKSKSEIRYIVPRVYCSIVFF